MMPSAFSIIFTSAAPTGPCASRTLMLRATCALRGTRRSRQPAWPRVKHRGTLRREAAKARQKKRALRARFSCSRGCGYLLIPDDEDGDLPLDDGLELELDGLELELELDGLEVLPLALELDGLEELMPLELEPLELDFWPASHSERLK